MTELGFTSVTADELQWLTDQARGKNLIVELGACYGHSTIALAKSKAKVITVDDFYGLRDPSFPESARADVYPIFLKNTKDYPNIEVVMMDHADYYPPEDCDMAFIDGDHAYENVRRDIERFLNHRNLFLCGHDYGYWPGVKKAVDELLTGVELFGNQIWFKQL